jgi:hypothetical protein
VRPPSKLELLGFGGFVKPLNHRTQEEWCLFGSVSGSETGAKQCEKNQRKWVETVWLVEAVTRAKP